MKLLSEIEDFVKSELKKIGAAFQTGEKDLLEVAGHSNEVLTAVKNWTVSPGGATLTSVIEALPVVGPFAQEIVNTILPDAVKAVAVIEADATDPEALITAGVTAIASKTDTDVIASSYNTVQALVTNKIAPLLGVASNIQAALSVAQTVYASVKK